MILNYLKVAFRLLIRNPFFSLINIVGLSVGFAVFFILWPYSQSQLKSDEFIKDHEQIVRLLTDFRWTDDDGENWGKLTLAATLGCFGPELMKASEDLSDITRFMSSGSVDSGPVGLDGDIIVAVGNNASDLKLFKERNVIRADANFVTFFGLPVVSGNGETMLRDQNAIVLTRSTAKRLFGDNPAINEIIRINNEPHQVTGIVEDMPKNSHLEFSMILSNAGQLNNWNTVDENQTFVFTYCKTKSPERVVELLNKNKDIYIGSFLRRFPHIRISYFHQPLTDILFSDDLIGDTFRPKSRSLMQALSVVSLIVLVMAWMNYINLTISKTSTRFKEMAARKVSGAHMPDLFLQFICQAAVVNLLAALLSITMIQLIRQPFELFLNIPIMQPKDMTLTALLFFSGIFTAGTCITAVYPAFVAFQFSTQQLLRKGKATVRSFLPSVLTTFQYASAIALIGWITVVYFQLNHVLEKSLGLDKDNVIVLEGPMFDSGEASRTTTMLAFAERCKNNPQVNGVTLSAKVVGDLIINSHLRTVGSSIFVGIDSHGGVDENFIPLYRLKLVAGRNFVKDEKSRGLIISEFASKRLGFKSPQEAVGQVVETAWVSSGPWMQVEIIGVIADYRVAPFYFSNNSSETVTGRGQVLSYLNTTFAEMKPDRISLRLDGFSQELVSSLEQQFNETFPGNLFTWYFLDSHVARHYEEQKISRNQIVFFTVLAIFVACLGLLGMIANKVVEKTKEIGIRKILGAQQIHIASILTKATARQIGVAILIGIPFMLYLGEDYQSLFVDRFEFQWWHYVIPVAVLVTIMATTIAATLVRAVRTNPADSLRYE